MKVALLASAALALVAASRAAGADPLAIEPASPRAVGRAGVGLVSEDSGLAALSNPAGLARRSQPRLTLALRLTDEAVLVRAQGSALETQNRSGPTAAPAIGVAYPLGERLVVAAAFTERRYSRRYPTPQFGQPAEDVAALFPTRYAGLVASSLDRVFAVGGAYRAAEWLAIGASVGGESASRSSTRSVWAGFSGRDAIGDPLKDLLLELEGSDAITPRASLGALIAPIDVPIEMALAATVRLPSILEGTARARATTNLGQPPAHGGPVKASLDQPGVVHAAAGLRYLGERVALEAGAGAAILWRRRAAQAWQLGGLSVVDESGARGELERVASLERTRSHFRVGAALDVAVIEGFLWITAGYAWTSAAVADGARNPLLSSPNAHLVALGAEVVRSGFTVSIGFSRAIAASVSVPPSTSVSMVNPFGEAAGSAPAGLGDYSYSADRGALTVEYAFE